jgi:hypothetical protein
VAGRRGRVGHGRDTRRRVTIANIRNCETIAPKPEYTVHHYDKQVNLSALRGVDLFQVHWGSPNIAHTMLSFDFGDGQPVCFYPSMPARRSTKATRPLAGFFRRYELVYVVGMNVTWSDFGPISGARTCICTDRLTFNLESRGW